MRHNARGSGVVAEPVGSRILVGLLASVGGGHGGADGVKILNIIGRRVVDARRCPLTAPTASALFADSEFSVVKKRGRPRRPIAQSARRHP